MLINSHPMIVKHIRTFPLMMLERGWLPWEIEAKLDYCGNHAKTLEVAVYWHAAAKWTRENL